ncbi:hypothetical protein ACLJJ6_02785 [Pediococcus siamensis]|uniref:hypothetical protein n=1 Tax=Pediococcus siamensis TaxID=381829 RepID=UPI0039A34E72
MNYYEACATLLMRWEAMRILQIYCLPFEPADPKRQIRMIRRILAQNELLDALKHDYQGEEYGNERSYIQELLAIFASTTTPDDTTAYLQLYLVGRVIRSHRVMLVTIPTVPRMLMP